MGNEKDIQGKLDQIMGEMEKLRQQANKSARAAEYASKGFVEINQEVHHIKTNWEQFNTRMSTLEGKVDNYIMMINKRFEDFQEMIKEDFEHLGDKVDSNLKWNIGITITLLSIFLALIKLL